MDRPDTRPTWTFLTHHARVLILIARDPGIRLRDVAVVCDVSEPAEAGQQIAGLLALVNGHTAPDEAPGGVTG